MKFAVLAACVALGATMAMDASANEKHMEEKVQYYFNQMDTDKNNSISKQEYNAYGERMFQQADANNNAALSMEELKEHKKEMKEEKHGAMDNDAQ